MALGNKDDALWNRCDVCGRFIALTCFCGRRPKATRRLVTLDSAFTSEEWETLCPDHANPQEPSHD